VIGDDDDNDSDNGSRSRTTGHDVPLPPGKQITPSPRRSTTPFNSEQQEYDEDDSTTQRRRNARPMMRTKKRNVVGDEQGASWMTRNAKFDSSSAAFSSSSFRPQQRDGMKNARNSSRESVGTTSSNRRSGHGRSDSSSGGVGNNNKTFRQDFRGTRVFVDGLPPHATWQNLKDHFRDHVFLSSDDDSSSRNNNPVVFASISTDPVTGASKGHGIVQFETTDLSGRAIALSSNVPFLEKYPPLLVRPDRQQSASNDDDDDKKQWKNSNNNDMPLRQTFRRRDESSSLDRRAHADWVCADEENTSSNLDEKDRQAVINLLAARNDARRRRDYDISDDIRQELKEYYGVHLDDRLHTWWTSKDGKHVPQAIREVRGGDGKWSNNKNNKSQQQLPPWRQIPTTPESDALVNPNLVNALLQQRDIARLERDFATADALLQEARAAPDDDDLYLRIHDESRTWRIWTPEPPPPGPRRPALPELQNEPSISSRRDKNDDYDDDKTKKNPRRTMQSPVEQCMALVQEHAPSRVGEIKLLLEKFVGREYQILKKLQSRYTSSESESSL
jgi:hypothetical protein